MRRQGDDIWSDPEVMAIVREHMSKAIKAIRGHRPQRAVAREIGVAGGTLSSWEKHRCPPEKHWEKIAHALGCTKEELMERAWEFNRITDARTSTIQDMSDKLDRALSMLELLNNRVKRLDHRLYRQQRRDAERIANEQGA